MGILRALWKGRDSDASHPEAEVSKRGNRKGKSRSTPPSPPEAIVSLTSFQELTVSLVPADLDLEPYPNFSSNPAFQVPKTEISIDYATSLHDSQVHAALCGLRNLDKLEGRLLILEPSSPEIVQALRQNGFTGEIWLAIQSQSLTPQIRQHTQLVAPDGQDSTVDPQTNTLTFSWPEIVQAHPTSQPRTLPDASNVQHDQLLASPVLTPHQLTNPNQYDVIITTGLLRHLPMGALPAAFAWLTSLLEPQGYLIIAEPDPPISLSQIEKSLASLGMQLAQDSHILVDGWLYTIGLFQRRSQAEISRVGWLYPLDWHTLSTTPHLVESLISTYQQVFGGPEWNEWAHCQKPGCGRYYSRVEWEARAPGYRCDCGAYPIPLFHTPNSIMTHVAEDLTSHTLSCCYVHSAATAASLRLPQNTTTHQTALIPSSQITPKSSQYRPTPAVPASIDSFLWGYFSPPSDLFHHMFSSSTPSTLTLGRQSRNGHQQDLPHSTCTQTACGSEASHTALTRLHQWEETSGREEKYHTSARAHDTSFSDQVFYVSELGVLPGLRSISMTRALFQRALQFADDHGATTVIGRTSRQSKAYRLLLGLGMEEIFSFASTPQEPNRTRATILGEDITSSTEDDSRVLLAGTVQTLLQKFSQFSDQRLITHIAHSLRYAHGPLFPDEVIQPVTHVRSSSIPLQYETLGGSSSN